jgi:hypothetical protein
MLNALITFAAVLTLAGLNWWLGRSGTLTRQPGDASARIANDLIDFQEREGEAANHGRARIALGAAPDDLAIAVVNGDGWVTRRLRPATVRSVQRDSALLQIRMQDFTLPHIALTFADAHRAGLWESRLAGLSTPSVSPAPAESLAGEPDGLA